MKSIKTFFYSLKRSLFSPAYYRDIAGADFGFSLKYLWFLFFLIIVFYGVGFGFSYVKNRPLIAPAVTKYMNIAYNFYPEDLQINITDGKLYTNVKEPYVVDLDKNDNGLKHLVIIDTKGSIENYPGYNTYVLATQNAVIFPSKSRNNRITETQVYFFKDLKQNLKLNKSVYDGLLTAVKPYAAKATFYVDWMVAAGIFLFLVFGTLFWLISTMFGLIFYTFIIWILNKLIKSKFSFSALYKMGMHGVTLPLLITEIIKYFKLPLPNLYGWIFLLWMIFLLFTLKNPKRVNK